MYCRNCGALLGDKAEMCVKCGCRLKMLVGSQKSILEGINIGNSSGDEVNLDFSELDPYYQKEFEKIYNSGEMDCQHIFVQILFGHV